MNNSIRGIAWLITAFASSDSPADFSSIFSLSAPRLITETSDTFRSNHFQYFSGLNAKFHLRNGPVKEALGRRVAKLFFQFMCVSERCLSRKCLSLASRKYLRVYSFKFMADSASLLLNGFEYKGNIKSQNEFNRRIAQKLRPSFYSWQHLSVHKSYWNARPFTLFKRAVNERDNDDNW